MILKGRIIIFKGRIMILKGRIMIFKGRIIIFFNENAREAWDTAAHELIAKLCCTP